jgi:hypothetical protein
VSEDQSKDQKRWSSDAPSVPGFYWCLKYGRPRVVYVWKYKDSGRLFTSEGGGAPLDDREMYGGAQWSGPIRTPAYA